MKQIVIFSFLLVAAGVLYAQPGATGYTRDNFPTAVSTAPNVIKLDLSAAPANAERNIEVEVHRDVVYVERDGTPLHLHILYPKGVTSALPCIVYVPGSAWRRQNTAMSIPNMTQLAARGYVVAIVEYRPSDIAAFPAQVQDAKTAIRFMRKNAQQYHVDVNNVFIWGDSSGGHTSLFVGFTQDSNELDTDVYGEFSNKVNAAVNYFGPSELAKMSEYPSVMNHNLPNSPEGMLIGGKNVLENLELARKASPVYYAHPNAVPVFTVHGDRDMLVHLTQSDLVAEALEKAGVEHVYYCLLGAGHGGREFWADEIVDIIIIFLDKHKK